MNTDPTLHDLQLWLKWIITDPRGVAVALKDPSPEVENFKSRYTAPTASFLDCLNSNSEDQTIERLDIYAEGYFSRILESMAESFARTKKIIGEDAFTKLVADYLKAYPSKFTTIDEVGYQFANFIKSYKDIDLEEWVSDIAHFEWGWISAFYAEETTLSDAWKVRLAENSNLRLRVHPSVQLIPLSWSIHELIERIDSGADIHTSDHLEKSENGILIYRFQEEVLWKHLDKPVFQLLSDIQCGTPFDEALLQTEGILPELISQSFTYWVERKIICGILDKT